MRSKTQPSFNSLVDTSHDCHTGCLIKNHIPSMSHGLVQSCGLDEITVLGRSTIQLGLAQKFLFFIPQIAHGAQLQLFISVFLSALFCSICFFLETQQADQIHNNQEAHRDCYLPLFKEISGCVSIGRALYVS